MGQSDIIQVLKKHKKPLSSKEIAEKTGYDQIHICHNISKLIKAKEIKIIEIDRKQAMKYYNSCRRMRLYYI